MRRSASRWRGASRRTLRFSSVPATSIGLAIGKTWPMFNFGSSLRRSHWTNPSRSALSNIVERVTEPDSRIAARSVRLIPNSLGRTASVQANALDFALPNRYREARSAAPGRCPRDRPRNAAAVAAKDARHECCGEDPIRQSEKLGGLCPSAPLLPNGGTRNHDDHHACGGQSFFKRRSALDNQRIRATPNSWGQEGSSHLPSRPVT